MDASIAKKLQVKDGRSARVLGTPRGLAGALAGFSSSGKGRFDVVLLFAADRAALAKGAKAALGALDEGAILWVAYPKKTSALASDLDRDHGWEVIHEAGFDPVTQVALDDTWSALRWKRDPALRAARVARGSMLAPADARAKAGAKRPVAAKATKPAREPATPKAKAATPKAKAAALKTQPQGSSVTAWVEALAEPRRGDARALVELMAAGTGAAPRLWSGNIVGFGDIHLRYDSGRELDWFLCGFSPRKDALAIYGLLGDEAAARPLLARLGKHSTGKGCLYVKRMGDVDAGVLAQLVKQAAARKGG